MTLRILLVALILAAIAPSVAEARTQDDYFHAYEQVWSAALRLIRVDLRCTIGDKDETVGYFTFELQEGGRTYPGSVELIRVEIDHRPAVRAVVQIPGLPTYFERMILDRLRAKLVSDYGPPPPAPPRRPPAAARPSPSPTEPAPTPSPSPAPAPERESASSPK